MSGTYESAHGLPLYTAPEERIPGPPPTPFPHNIGRLLIQRPHRRVWTFDKGISGRHNPALRAQLNEHEDING